MIPLLGLCSIFSVNEEHDHSYYVCWQLLLFVDVAMVMSLPRLRLTFCLLAYDGLLTLLPYSHPHFQPTMPLMQVSLHS